MLALSRWQTTPGYERNYLVTDMGEPVRLAHGSRLSEIGSTDATVENFNSFLMEPP